MSTHIIYFTVGGRTEQVEFSENYSDEEVAELFRVAGEAKESDLLKLFNSQGNVIRISAKLRSNNAETKYHLEVVSTLSRDLSTAAKFGVSLAEIEIRLRKLSEHIVFEKFASSDHLNAVRIKVDTLREKLESFEHLSWLGLHKELQTTPNLHYFWIKHKTPPRTEETLQKIFDRVNQMRQVQLATEVREYLKKPSFSNWQWDDAEMILLLRQMFLDLNLLAKCNIEMSTLLQFLCEVYRCYNDVPFHNFKHGFMVAQMMYSLIWMIGVDSKLQDYEILALLISPICHDLDHPGYNNAYQVNAHSDLALLYNDISPLENHHCSVTFEILSKKSCDILANLDTETYKKTREIIIRCILATDMSKHYSILSSFKSIITTFDIRNKEHKETFIQILIKIADISNEARPIEAGALWVDCLLEEFFNQSDMEKLEGLPVAPFMDRDMVTKASSQVGFIKFVLLPLYESLGELYPHLVPDLVEPVRVTLQYYTDLHQAIELEKKRKEEQARAAALNIDGRDLGHKQAMFSSKKTTERHRDPASARRNLGWNPKNVTDTLADWQGRDPE